MFRGWIVAASILSSVGLPALGGLDPGAPREASASADTDPLCVEAGRYRVLPEVVIDLHNEGRTWQRRASERLPHAEAQRYCAGLVLGGMRGFRLPTPDELNSIRYKPGGLFGGHRHYCVPSIDQAAFPETPAAEFWTSRISPDGTAWYVGFDDGRSHRDDASDPLWVRCVRDAR